MSDEAQSRTQTSVSDEMAADLSATGQREPRSARLAYLIGIAGWIMPGLGHAILEMGGRAGAGFLTGGAPVVIGAGLRGNLFSAGGGDAFATLGYITEVGTGAFYLVAKSLEVDGPDVWRAG